VNEFRKKLNELVSSDSYKGTLRAVAERAGVDHGLLHRVLKGVRAPTPDFVGRFCGMLNADEAKQLLVAFLTDVAKETAKAYPRARKSAPTKVTIHAEV
jgi:transcriptional regulator with XRE-family HTH domain